MSPLLTDPIHLAGRTAPSRVLFGPHVTNLGRGRALSERHVAYYARRAAGGAGVVVTETASVHGSDRPYERAPLAEECEAGWAAVAEACRPHGTLVLAGLGHAGGQGSPADADGPLWAPSRVPDVVTGVVPLEVEQEEIDALVAGFAAAARTAVAAGVDGVEVDAGAVSLLRAFLSGLTNTRTDGYGTDRARLLREVLTAVRSELGEGPVLGLRLSCDELAPWGGITPEQAELHVRGLAPLADLLVVVRGGAAAPGADRPDGHTAPGFNAALTRRMRSAAGRTPVVLQGSVVDPAAAQLALDDGTADAVEMTRALLADADLVAKVRAGTPERVRPCTLCNQACQVRDVRNPLASCVVDPRTGHETEDLDPEGPDSEGDSGHFCPAGQVVVVGAGPAGLEAARVLAGAGARVRVVERSGRTGGALPLVAALPGRDRFALFGRWLADECARLDVRIATGRAATAAELTTRPVVLATGGGPGPYGFAVEDGARVVDAAAVLAARGRGVDRLLSDGPVLVWDPVGDATGVGVAELLAATGRQVALATPDDVAGVQLAAAGDLAPANGRLQRAGVARLTGSLLRRVRPGRAELEDRWTGALRTVICADVVDAGFRVAGPPGDEADDGLVVGDAVAPRTVLEAVLEGRRAALGLLPGEGVGGSPTAIRAPRR